METTITKVNLLKEVQNVLRDKIDFSKTLQFQRYELVEIYEDDYYIVECDNLNISKEKEFCGFFKGNFFHFLTGEKIGSKHNLMELSAAKFIPIKFV